MGQRLVRAKADSTAGIPFIPERGFARAARHAGRHLRRVRGGLDGPSAPCRAAPAARGSHVSGATRHRVPDNGSLGPAGTHATRESRRRARHCERRIRSTSRAGFGIVGRKMIAEAETLLRRLHLGAIGRYQLEAALQSAHVIAAAQSGELGRGGAALRCAVRARWIAGGCNQSRLGARGVARSQRRSCSHARGRRRRAPSRIPGLLGGTRGIAGKIRRTWRCQ